MSDISNSTTLANSLHNDGNTGLKTESLITYQLEKLPGHENSESTSESPESQKKATTLQRRRSGSASTVLRRGKSSNSINSKHSIEHKEKDIEYQDTLLVAPKKHQRLKSETETSASKFAKTPKEEPTMDTVVTAPVMTQNTISGTKPLLLKFEPFSIIYLNKESHPLIPFHNWEEDGALRPPKNKLFGKKAAAKS